MAVAYQASRPTAGTGTSSAPSLPTGAAAGDLILIKIGLKTGTAQTWTVPSGYTNVIDAANGANVRVAWWWKTIAAGDVTTGTVSCSWTTSVAFQYELVRLTGHDTTTPFAAGSTATGTGSLSPGTAPTVTGANGGELVVSIDEQQGGSGANYSAWTNSALEQWDSSSGTGTNISSGGATKDLTASGATGTTQATLAGSSQIWIGSSVAVSPAPAVAYSPNTSNYRYKIAMQRAATW